MTDTQTLTMDEVNTLLQTGSVRASKTHGAIKMKIPKRKEDAPEWQQFGELSGQPISQSDAIERYKLNRRNIQRWMEKGIIRVIGRDKDDGRIVLLDEQDVAYCSEIYKERGAPGRWLFTDTGAPYPVVPRRRKSDKKRVT